MSDCNPKPFAKETLVAAGWAIAALTGCVDQPMAPDLDGARLHVPAGSDRVLGGIDRAELDRLEREAELGHPALGRLDLGRGLGDRDDEMGNPVSGVPEPTRPDELARSPARLDNAASDIAARRLDLDIPEVCHRDSPALDFERGWIFFDDDCDALLAAMDQLRGTVHLNWDTATVMTEWDGVFLGTFGVEQLYLHNRGLDGSLPPELGALENVEVLSLGRNSLTGELPSELGAMRSLERLYLQDNDLTGEMPPEWGGLTRLKRLYLWRNQLTGEIPSAVGSMRFLERLNLGGNRLTGRIPPELGSLRAHLVDLQLWGNELTGPIPTEFGNLYYLKRLSLSRNKLTGEIPSELASLRNIEALWLYSNQLTGPMPTAESYGAWENLRVLWLQDNELSGPVPAELGNTDLHSLAIGDNAALAGPLPLALQSLLLDAFYWHGTGLCSPAEPSFQAWLASIDEDNHRGGPVCDSDNRSPVRVGSPDDATLQPGDSATVDASDYFRDPDGDALTYTASSSNASVATVSVSGNTVTVKAVAGGSATIRVTARDPGGLTAEQAFGVTVAGDTGGDYKTISGLTITQSGALKWGNYTGSGCVGASRVTINGVDYEVHWTEWQRRDNAAGSAWAQVSGTRKNGQLCGYRLANAQAGVYRFAGEFTVGGVRGKYKSENEVTVGGSGNQRPRTVGSISAKTLQPGDSTTVDASDYFRDPDGDALTYTASSSSASVATASVSGNTVTVRAVADGSATIRVTARDPGGLTAEQAFSVTVAGDTGGDYKTLAGFRVHDDGGLTLRLGGLTNVVGKAACIAAGSFTLGGKKYGYHETWWERDTGSGWQEVAGSKKTGLCGYDLGSAPSGKYRAVGDMTIADVRDKYKSENEVTK